MRASRKNSGGAAELRRRSEGRNGSAARGLAQLRTRQPLPWACVYQLDLCPAAALGMRLPAGFVPRRSKTRKRRRFVCQILTNKVESSRGLEMMNCAVQLLDSPKNRYTHRTPLPTSISSWSALSGETGPPDPQAGGVNGAEFPKNNARIPEQLPTSD